MRRAFEVGEREDEGMHFFLELADGRVLYLGGQYLYDYQEIRDDSELMQGASFPCSEFEVWRHKTARWVHSIRCRWPYLKPEAMFPPFSRAFVKAYGDPSDGEMFSSAYEELRRRFLGGKE